MEIIGEKKRLVGCNMKVVESLSEYNNSRERMGEIYEIKSIIARNNYYFSTSSSFNHQEIKIVLDDEFLKKFKTKKIAVNCRTEVEANQFCKWMHDNELRWKSGGSYLRSDEFLVHLGDTCYTGKGSYSNLNYYRSEKYTILKFSDCVFTDEYIKSIEDMDNNEDNKGETMSSEKEYKIVKSFKIKDIIDKELDSDIIEDIIFDMVDNGKSSYDKFNEDDFDKYEDIMDNIDWFINNGFIEEVKKPKTFEPFELKIKIDNPGQLKELWCRLNISSGNYEDLCNSFDYYVKNNNNNDLKNWRQVNKEMYRVEGI